MKVILRESPVGDHQANGDAECAVREIKRQVRVLRYALEERMGPTRRSRAATRSCAGCLQQRPMLSRDIASVATA